VLALTVAPAGADVFGPISLASEGSVAGEPAQQAEYAHDTAISGNGRYVAFDGSIGGVTGVWRAEVAAGTVRKIEQVAGGDAQLPSLSESGRNISFTTNEGASLARITDGRPHNPEPGPVNVYVRDMGPPEAPTSPQQAGAFTVVSAPDGEEVPLTYSDGGAQSTAYGTVALGRSAISADGNEVAFVTTAVSNLVRYPQLEREEEEKGETPRPHTPALQVAVRFLETHKTVLVSQCYLKCEAAAPAVSTVQGSTQYGAVYPGPSPGFGPPPAYGEYSLSPPPGASISADGTTVAWMGENIEQQAPLLPAETKGPLYLEPLWRRIGSASPTPTERITGGSDPGNQACLASGEEALPGTEHPSPADPCQGPFVLAAGALSGILNEQGMESGRFAPQLSADGYTVAFVSEAPLVTLGENFGRGDHGQPSDLYVADMHPGLIRDQALTQLTELAGGTSSGLADTAPIYDFAISPNGGQVAFTTRRTQFPLGSPAFISPPAGEPGLNELFDVDLDNHTLTRVTHGFQGPDEPSEAPHKPVLAGEDPYKSLPGDGALSPSFSADGGILAFSSTAANLVFGDGNAPPAGPLDGSDAFLTERVTFAPLPTAQYISPAPETAPTPVWRLGLTALSRANGSVLLFVELPGSGTLRAGAQGAVVLASAHGARAARRARHASRARVKAAETVVTRTVATHMTETKGAGLTTLTLTLAPFYAALARSRDGLSATVTVAFTAPGHPMLRQSIPVTFLRKVKPSRSKARSSKTRKSSAKGVRHP